MGNTKPPIPRNKPKNLIAVGKEIKYKTSKNLSWINGDLSWVVDIKKRTASKPKLEDIIQRNIKSASKATRL